MTKNTMLQTKKELIEYFKYSIGVNLKAFKVLSRKYLEYKLESIGLKFEEIKLIETGSDPQIPEIMYSKFKVDEFDIVIKQLIHNSKPDEPYILVECDECHEINERSFSTLLEFMAAINYFSSHKLHKKSI